MRRYLKSMILIIIVVLAIVITLMPYPRSQVIMTTASWIESFKVVGRSEGVAVEFVKPASVEDAGLFWYPHMLIFNSYGVPLGSLELEGEGSVDVSIYYTFCDFVEGRSMIYDMDSPYNSAFYGAYIIKHRPEDLSEYILSLKKLTEAVTRYDYTKLILSQLGLNEKNAYFDPVPDKIRNDVYAFGSDGWSMLDAHIWTRSTAHHENGFKQHYIQFGKPADSDTTEDFPEITLYGRTYGKYFEEEDLYIVFYIQAMDLSLVQLTDDLLLSKSRVIN